MMNDKLGNEINIDKTLLLHQAVLTHKYGQFIKVQNLLEDPEIDVNAQDEKGNTAYHLAIINLLPVLNQARSILELFDSVEFKILQVFKDAFQDRFDLEKRNTQGQSVNFLLKQEINVMQEIVKFFNMEKVYYENATLPLDRQIIYHLTYKKEFKYFNSIFDNRAGELIIQSIGENNLKAVVDLLACEGIPINTLFRSYLPYETTFGTVLHWAVRETKPNIQIIKALLKYQGIDVNVQDDRGRTALYYVLDKAMPDFDLHDAFLKHPKINLNVPVKNEKTVIDLFPHYLPSKIKSESKEPYFSMWMNEEEEGKVPNANSFSKKQ